MSGTIFLFLVLRNIVRGYICTLVNSLNQIMVAMQTWLNVGSNFDNGGAFESLIVYNM